MKAKYLIITEFLLLTLFLILLNTGAHLSLTASVKTLLMPVLIAFILVNKSGKNTFLVFIITALALSTAGDLFMELQTGNDNFFLPGLASFLMAHIVYILAFTHKLKVKIFSLTNTLVAMILVILLSGLIIFLWPRLGEMKIPVLIYGIIITLATFTAYLRACKEYKKCLLFWGAVLFLLSDAILAIYLFYSHFPLGREINMVLYVTGQTLIAVGSINLKPTRQ